MKKRADIILAMLVTPPEEEITERDASPSFIENTPERDVTPNKVVKDVIAQVDTSRVEKTEDEPKTRSSSTSSSTSSSSSSLSSKILSSSDQSRHTNLATRSSVRPNYQVSPIHTDESDVDLSDSDPTYPNNTRRDVRNIPPSSSSSSPSPPPRNDLRSDDTPRQSRKRKRDPDNWKQNRIKILRNSGKSYLSLSKLKKQVPARSIKACKG